MSRFKELCEQQIARLITLWYGTQTCQLHKAVGVLEI